VPTSSRLRRLRAPRVLERSERVVGLFETERPGGLHERVYRSLIHAIASGKFQAGSRLPSEIELAATYSVSRPVLRQALLRLRDEGAVHAVRGSGNYVARLGDLPAEKPSLTDVVQELLHDLDFRLLIEPEAARRAAWRRSRLEVEQMKATLGRFEEAHANGAVTHHLDYSFHEAIAAASGNPRFVGALRGLEYPSNDERILIRHLTHFAPQARGAKIIAEHAEVLSFIQAREPEAARDAMKAHIKSARGRLVKLIPRPPAS
jgi:GntR family transcriptional regulator, transcriptional repressor for pyruvate dehydrogenase complex